MAIISTFEICIIVLVIGDVIKIDKLLERIAQIPHVIIIVNGVLLSRAYRRLLIVPPSSGSLLSVQSRAQTRQPHVRGPALHMSCRQFVR